MRTDRVRVTIKCNLCGERFTLRGKKDVQGKVETGFKQCLCDNSNDFDVAAEDMPLP